MQLSIALKLKPKRDLDLRSENGRPPFPIANEIFACLYS